MAGERRRNAVPDRLDQRWVVLAGGVAPTAPRPWAGRGHLIVFGLPEAEEALWSALDERGRRAGLDDPPGV